MSHDHGKSCLCMTTHRPYPLELNAHHVWPLGMGGPDTANNIVWLCPSAHYNVHELLRHMVRADRTLSNYELRAMYDVPVSEYAAQIARQGLLAYQDFRGA